MYFLLQYILLSSCNPEDIAFPTWVNNSRMWCCFRCSPFFCHRHLWVPLRDSQPFRPKKCPVSDDKACLIARRGSRPHVAYLLTGNLEGAAGHNLYFVLVCLIHCLALLMHSSGIGMYHHQIVYASYTILRFITG